ncbi:hypothetical protein [Sphingobacterium pedocola]|nr:hypothetical protein [Sphingobacterium pedocola]
MKFLLRKSLLFFYFGKQSTFMNQQDIIKEIGQIRSIMEKSSKFISISGLSGVLIGTYALIGAALGYLIVYGFKSQFGYRDHFVTDEIIIVKLLLIALFVLLISIVTGVLMAKRKAKRINQSIWNATSRSLLFAVAVPLITGGVFSLIIFAKGYYGLIASSLLIFYGLALNAASTYTFKEVKWLGIFEIILGLLALCFPGYGLWFWALGFGVLHIIYGLIVYKRYE